MSDNDEDAGATEEAARVVSGLGRLLKSRVREFAQEVQQEIRGKLRDVREELDEELSSDAPNDEKG